MASPLAMLRLRRVRRNTDRVLGELPALGFLGLWGRLFGLLAGFLDRTVDFLVGALGFALRRVRRAGLAFGGWLFEGVLGATSTRLRMNRNNSAACESLLTRQYRYLFLT